jgi:hypothetical protein
MRDNANGRRTQSVQSVIAAKKACRTAELLQNSLPSSQPRGRLERQDSLTLFQAVIARPVRRTAEFDGKIGRDAQKIPEKPAENWGSCH